MMMMMFEERRWVFPLEKKGGNIDIYFFFNSTQFRRLGYVGAIAVEDTASTVVAVDTCV